MQVGGGAEQHWSQQKNVGTLPIGRVDPFWLALRPLSCAAILLQTLVDRCGYHSLFFSP